MQQTSEAKTAWQESPTIAAAEAYRESVGDSSVDLRNGQDGSGMMEFLASTIRRYPWAALTMGVGVGYLLSRRARPS